MMELADVPDSKSGGSDTVRVRPPLPAPKQKRTPSWVFFFVFGSGCENPQKNQPSTLDGWFLLRRNKVSCFATFDVAEATAQSSVRPPALSVFFFVFGSGRENPQKNQPSTLGGWFLLRRNKVSCFATFDVTEATAQSSVRPPHLSVFFFVFGSGRENPQKNQIEKPAYQGGFQY